VTAVSVWLVGPDVRADVVTLLARCAGADPAEVRIARTGGGKPYLERPAGSDVRFSVSHSGELAVIAVARGRAVGVDVQAAREVPRAQAIADRRFMPSEATRLRALPGRERRALFHRLWVRKEAYLKATGAGLAGSLASFDALTLEPPAPGWEFGDLELPEGYAGALALAPAAAKRPGGWRATKPAFERMFLCQRDPRGPLRPLVSKRRPATTMYMWPPFA
jgi:4'-phosphopantetheinyl transferase